MLRDDLKDMSAEQIYTVLSEEEQPEDDPESEDQDDQYWSYHIEDLELKSVFVNARTVEHSYLHLRSLFPS